MVAIFGSSWVDENSKTTRPPTGPTGIGLVPGAPQNILARTGLPSTTSRGAPDVASTRTVRAANASVQQAAPTITPRQQLVFVIAILQEVKEP
jgi:hypothetical protein